MAPSPEAQPSALAWPLDHPAKAVDQPILLPTISRSPLTNGVLREPLTTEPAPRDRSHSFSPDQLPGEAIQFRQEAGHVIEVEKPTVDGGVDETLPWALLVVPVSGTVW